MKKYKAEFARLVCYRCGKVSTYYGTDKDAEKEGKRRGWILRPGMCKCPLCVNGRLT